MKKTWKSAVAIAVAAGLSLAACGGSGSSSSSDTSSTKRVKNAVLTVAPTTTIDPWSKSCANGGGCRLGDTGPGGGVVFYSGTTPIDKVDGISDGGVYLEMIDLDPYYHSYTAPAPYNTVSGWPTWGCRKTSILDSKNEEIGGGAKSTNAILNGCSTTNIVARVVANHTQNNLSDWFLPSVGELEQFCMFFKGSTQGTINVGGQDKQVTMCDGSKALPTAYKDFDTSIWTSNEGNWEYAAAYSMTTGKSGGVRKDTEATKVVGVRAFGTYVGPAPATTTTTLPPTCAKGGVCKVGDTGPAGGTVFYVGSSAINNVSGVSSGGKYMEFIAYGSKVPYGCTKNSKATTSDAIGSGAQNSLNYMNACDYVNSPSRTSLASTAGGQSDWFVPSLNELTQICRYAHNQEQDVNGTCNGKGTLRPGITATSAYWSSTQYSSNAMYVIAFDSGDVAKRDKGDYKYDYFLVRSFG